MKQNASQETAFSDLLRRVKSAAVEYEKIAGRPLGVTGEVAELEASQLLDLELAEARQPGFDATRTLPDGQAQLIQIKGRRLDRGRNANSGRLGSLSLDSEWDFVLLVLLDGNFDAFEIYEADRSTVKIELEKPGSRARNERGQLSVSKFKSIGHRVFPA